MPTPRGTQFHTALQLHSKPEPAPLSTGIPQLDKILAGGLKPPHLHLFYGEDNTPDKLLTRLTLEAVKAGGHTIHIVCGDYRRNPTTLDIEDLLRLLETQNMDEDALSRIHVIPAFSQHQVLNTPHLVQQLMENKTRLLTIQQISKLFYSRHIPSLVDPAEFKKTISQLREVCATHSVALAASCRAKKRGTGSTPEPVGGSYLRHSAAVLVYLRGQRGGVASAVLVKHFDRARVGRRISFHKVGEEELGRIIGSSIRKRIQDSLRILRSMYREALKGEDMQEAFDEVWQSWSMEEGAMVYTEVASALDLINLTGVVANRREIRRLRAQLKEALEAHSEG